MKLRTNEGLEPVAYAIGVVHRFAQHIQLADIDLPYGQAGIFVERVCIYIDYFPGGFFTVIYIVKEKPVDTFSDLTLVKPFFQPGITDAILFSGRKRRFFLAEQTAGQNT